VAWVGSEVSTTIAYCAEERAVGHVEEECLAVARAVDEHARELDIIDGAAAAATAAAAGEGLLRRVRAGEDLHGRGYGCGALGAGLPRMRLVEAPASITRDGDYDNFFPSASLKYSFLPNLQAQFGYAHAISRPPIDALAGVWNINDVTLLITAPNPKLKPERSDNYVARLAYYFEPVGSFTVLVQQTEITDQRITVRGKAADFGFENDPEYAAYDFQSLDNNDSLYRYRSLELSYNQQLSFLPGLLRTTNLNLSYTRNYANQYFPGVTPHKVAGSLGWSIGRLSFRSGVVWQDDTPFTSVFGRFQRHNLKVDFGGSYRLSDRLSFFFQGRNVLNDPNLLYEGDPLRGQPAVLYRYGNFGVSWVAGVKGNF
jgi:outer membrane receptor protein involved in Fe transport